MVEPRWNNTLMLKSQSLTAASFELPQSYYYTNTAFGGEIISAYENSLRCDQLGKTHRDSIAVLKGILDVGSKDIATRQWIQKGKPMLYLLGCEYFWYIATTCLKNTF